MKFRTTRAAGVALGVAFALTGTACSTATTTSSPEVAAVTPAFTGDHVAAAEFGVAAAAPGVMIIDVRTPDEYASGHIAGAVNADVNSTDFEGLISALDPAKDYAVYCQSGNRSRAALTTMAALGYSNTVGLDGGITAWTDAGYAVTK
jgi:rhodanese-related sulfurtransferase